MNIHSYTNDMNEINTYLLNDRISKTAEKYLLIFPNEQILQWYKRYLNRDDIIYLNEKSSLVGLRYKNWLYVNQGMTKEDINTFLEGDEDNETNN